MPGIGIKIAARILMCVGDCSGFKDATRRASYAGVAPITRRSGTSIHSESPSRSGNRQLKNAFLRSAWIASHCHEASRQYYQRKREGGKRHNAAAMCLACRRCNIIYAMLTRREFFREIPPTKTPQQRKTPSPHRRPGRVPDAC
ncbi:transposase [Corynebacterium uberis]|nr:transposase [Corynebacterium uberis]UDL79199.1 transposase [Corynebacterium uberis]UDL81404.1 transposase [Corynebacterium uberis]UDL83617.1 transposase [Corynebacterium uberis]UDL85826.1 transposase [Corynebacterium uberis]